MKTYRLSDSVIAHIAQVLQLALLTGTDLVDHLRAISMVEGEQGTHVTGLDLHPDYANVVENFKAKLIEEAEKLQAGEDRE